MKALPSIALLSIALATASAGAATVDVVGLFPGKAVVAVDGGPPHSISVGDTVGGMKLVAVSSSDATFLVDGKRRTVAMGSYLAGRSGDHRASATLTMDARGHYVAQGSINGSPTQFLVDTGATMVVLPASEADRLAIDYRRAPQGVANTANGPVSFRVVKLDRVKIGDVELDQVEAGVMQGGYNGPVLLGMTFLSRTEVTRDGQNMVLTKRF